MSVPRVPDLPEEGKPVEPSIPWDEPIPLRPQFVEPDFPVDALPSPYGEMVEGVAEATQTPTAMAGVTALSVIAAAAGGCAEVEVRDGWVEPLGLFTAVIAGPGERKSAVQAAFTKPLRSAEAELVERSKVERLEAQTLKEIAAKAAATARAEASKLPGSQRAEAAAEALAAAMQADEIEVPPVARLLAGDATPEAAASLLAEHKRLAIVSAEGGVIDTIGGRYSSGVPNMDIFLQAHAGEAVRIDRKNRESEFVERPSLTLALMVQPSLMEAIGRNVQFRGRGLLARFLFVEPVSRVGYRKSNAAPVPREVIEAHTTALKGLVLDMSKWAGDPAAIQLTDESRRAVIDLMDDTELELREGGVLSPLKDWGSKYAGAVMRIAGLLHLALHGESGVRKPIELETIESAIRLGEFVKAHAIRAFATMGSDGTTPEAEYVLRRIVRTGRSELSQRDIFNETRSRIKRVQDLLPSLSHLVDHGLLVRLPAPEQHGPGRPPAPLIAVHPRAGEYCAERA